MQGVVKFFVGKSIHPNFFQTVDSLSNNDEKNEENSDELLHQQFFQDVHYNNFLDRIS